MLRSRKIEKIDSKKFENESLYQDATITQKL